MYTPVDALLFGVEHTPEQFRGVMDDLLQTLQTLRNGP